MANESEIVVVGAGCQTSVGANLAATSAACRAGIANFTEHPVMIDKNGDPVILAQALEANSGGSLSRRLFGMIRSAAHEAAGPLPILPEDRVGICLALPASRPGFPQEEIDLLKEQIGSAIPAKHRTPFEVLPCGHAAGLLAVDRAQKILRGGQAEWMIVMGGDSYGHWETIDWLFATEQLHCPGFAWGFVPGEAAAALALTTADRAERGQIPVVARLRSLAIAQEQALIRTDDVCVGQGLTEAMQGALGGIDPQEQIDETYLDLNGDRYRSSEWGFAALRTADRFRHPGDFHCPAEAIGDVGSATSLVHVALAADAFVREDATGPRALFAAGSDSGERVAAVLEFSSLSPEVAPWLLV